MPRILMLNVFATARLCFVHSAYCTIAFLYVFKNVYLEVNGESGAEKKHQHQSWYKKWKEETRSTVCENETGEGQEAAVCQHKSDKETAVEKKIYILHDLCVSVEKLGHKYYL